MTQISRKLFNKSPFARSDTGSLPRAGGLESEATRPGSSLSSKVAYMCVFQMIFRKRSRSLGDRVRRHRCGSSSQIMIAL